MVVGVGVTVAAGPALGVTSAISFVTNIGGVSGFTHLAASVGAMAGAVPAIATGASQAALTSVLSTVAGSMLTSITVGAEAVALNGAIAAVTGAITTASSALGSAAAMEGAVIASTLAGPIGWAVLGAVDNTWDCWKPVVMDNSIEPSSGITLRGLDNHPNLRQMRLHNDGFLAENIRGDVFRLSPVNVGGGIAFHATQISLMLSD